MHTATVVAAPHHLDVVPKDGLREISHGRWEGMSRKEVEEKFPDEYARWESDPFSFAPREGESGLCVTARALPVLLDLVERHPADHIVVVSHKATIRLLLSSLLGFDPRRFRDRLDQSPCAINILDFKTPAHPRLVLFNDTSHYDTDAIPAIPQNRLSKVWDEK